MTTHLGRFIAMALAIAFFALTTSAAMGQSYTGKWQATVTGSRNSNGTYCVTLTDNGSFGTPHSGPAELNGTEDPYSAYFTVVDGLITVTFPSVSGPGDCCDFFVFTARASNGRIGDGVFNYFGPGDFGVVAFGKKDSCSN
jgi:hypothetical protein